MKKLIAGLVFAAALGHGTAEAGQGTHLSITNASDQAAVVTSYLGSYCVNDYGGHGSHPDKLATTIQPGQTVSQYVEAQGWTQGCIKPFSDSYFTAAFEGNKAAGCFGYQVADNGYMTLGIEMGIPASDPSSNATPGFGDLVFSQTKNVDDPNNFKIAITIGPASGSYSEEQQSAMLSDCRTKAENDISNGGSNP